MKLLPLLLAFTTICPPTTANTDYYLSLGDSLSVGYQPDSTGTGHTTTNGYDNDLTKTVRNLKLIELGCPGESTTTMIHGGICKGIQLTAAVKFLKEHHVPLVTLSIGANDVDACAGPQGVDLLCVQQGLANIKANLTTIVTTLRKADPDAKFIGLNEYDPFLATYLQGQAGQQEATLSVALVQQLNQLLATGYHAARYRIADVQDAFHTTDFTTHHGLPLNVATICRLTFMCAAPPVGPNIHPTNAGYRVIAAAIAAQLK